MFNQVKAVAEVIKKCKPAAVALLVSKLRELAQTFFAQNPNLKNVTNLETLCKEFADFFAPLSKCLATFELFNLTLMPFETIKNLAYRLNILAATVYANLQDPKARDTVKFMKFIDAISSQVRSKIREARITDYRAAVERDMNCMTF